MAQNLIQPPPYEGEIDLLKIIKVLLESKKLIFLTTLIIIIASVIYSLSLKPSFKTSVIVEIGYTIMPDGTKKIIEEPSNLISNLNLYKYLNSQENTQTSFKDIENKIILIETTSNSSEQNENLLAEIIRYIDERHSNFTLLTNNQKKDVISRQIEMIESELSFVRTEEISKIEDKLAKLTNELPFIDLEIRQLEKKILDDTNNLSLLKENDNMLEERVAISSTLMQVIVSYKVQINTLIRNKSSITQEIKSLNNQLQNLENGTFQSDQLFRLGQEKATLENELQMMMSQTQVNTRLIGNIETDTLKPKTLLIISLAIIIGFITSIFLVFIRNFIKSFKEIQA